jgi:hypothetical protein
MRQVVPPEQHKHPDVKPERSPDKIAQAQMGDCFELCDYGEAKGDPIERHDGHENWCYETHRG